MKTTFHTNLTCQNCVAKVRPLLDQEQSVVAWSVDTQNVDKPLTVESNGQIDSQRIVDIVAKAGFRATAISSPPSGAAPSAEKIDSATQVDQMPAIASDQPSRFQLSTYRPLLLVVGYVLGLTVLLEYQQGTFELHRAMRWFMGFFFLGFAFFKLLDVSKFADAFASYDIVARRSRIYALSYPWIEFALGLAFILDFQPFLANVVTAIIMAVGLVGVIAAVRKKQAIQCACLGTAFNLPMSAVTIIENSAMIAMAIASLVTML